MKKICVDLKYVLFAIFGLFVAIFSVIVFLKRADENYLQAKISAYLKDPRVGDNVIVKKDNNSSPFTILKITKIEGDLVEYTWSQFSFSSLDGIKEQILNPQEDRGQGTHEMKKAQLTQFAVVEVFGQLRPVR